MSKGKNQIYKKLTMSLSPTLKRPVYYSECRSRSLFIKIAWQVLNVLFGKPVIIKSQLFHFYLFFPLYCRKTLKSVFSTWIIAFVDFVVFFSEWTVRSFFFLIIEISNIHEFYYKNMFIIWFFNTDFELCYDFYVFVWKTHFKKKMKMGCDINWISWMTNDFDERIFSFF